MPLDSRSVAILLTVVLLAVLVPASAIVASTARGWVVIECDGRTAAIVPLGARPVIVYNWTHSVEWTLISEWLLPERDGLVLFRVMSKSFGAGHPYNAREIGGSRVEIVNGTMVYDAWEPVGRELSIMGGSWVPSNISLILPGGRVVVCEGFETARIRIFP